MKVFISIDMEGISGLTYWKEKQERISFFMTEELLSAIEGIMEVEGNSEILVCDSHSFGRNIDIGKLPKNVKLVSGFPRKFYMVQGIDETFDAGIFIGYHAPVGTENAEMDHTYSSSSIYEIKINGMVVGETEINAAFLGEYSVPVVLVSGDDKLKNFSQKNLKGTHFVVTKESIGRYSALLYPVEKVHKELKENTKLALQQIEKIKPFTFEKPINIEITFLDTIKAELVSLIPNSERKGGRTVSFKSDSFKDIYRFLMSSIVMASFSKNL